MSFTKKEKYDFRDLVEIMKYLRTPDGCPWDRVQTHESIRSNLIEETYEVIEAIDNKDNKLMQEELGDLLLQVIFHAELAEEDKAFNIDDVINDICQKLVIRHPHVFGDIKADNSEMALKNWDDVKMATKSQKKQSQAMDSVSKALPSLMRATKIQQKAAKIGFNWPDIMGALKEVSEVTQKLKEAIYNNDSKNQAEELGNLLFSIVNVARFLKIDSEQSLYNACDKFTERFRLVEDFASQRNIDMKTASLSVLYSLWDEVKK